MRAINTTATRRKLRIIRKFSSLTGAHVSSGTVCAIHGMEDVMLSKFTTLIIIAATWLFIAALPTSAQAQTAQMRFQGMDVNRDGVITRDEWRGSDRAFQNQDWNGDGRLSGNEVRVGARRDGNYEEADHEPNRYERYVT